MSDSNILSHSLQQKKLAVCCLARDCATRLKPNIARLKKLSRYLAEVRYFVVENDSKDSTRNILSHWQNIDDYVILPDVYEYQNQLIKVEKSQIANATTPSQFKIDFDRGLDALQDRKVFMQRIKRISFARDCYLEALAVSDFRPDYVMMLDVDIHFFNLHGVLDTLCSTIDWDIVAANGRKFELYVEKPYIRDIYYDSYAVELLDGESKAFDWNIELQTKFADLNRGDEWRSVHSAFGGMCIYRYEVLFDVSHRISKPRVTYMSAIAKDGFQYCEHISLHRALRALNYNKIFVNPSMSLYYNTLFLARMRRLLSRIKTKG